MADNPSKPPPPPSAPPNSNAATEVSTTPAPAAKPKLKPSAPQGNPAFRAMGLPNWRPKLPSRNWMIFFTIVGSFTGTLLYDRRMKKKEQQKWCTLVSHVAHQSIPTNSTVRKVTIYLAAPPGDSLRTAREHFVEYVKPILVAGGLDWDVVEGRREGEVRAGLAERIRKFRRRKGEGTQLLAEEDLEVAIEQLRARTGVQEWEGQKGDVVVGRHAWKEYVRGIHEGWLGSLTPPEPPPKSAPAPSETLSEKTTTQNPETATDQISSVSENHDSASQEEPPADKAAEEKGPEEPEAPLVPPAHNATSSYSNSPLPPSIPPEFAASSPVTFSHILGFRNTPIRLYRFLTRRYLADAVGRQTAAVVLATYRPYIHSQPHEGSGSTSDPYLTEVNAGSEQWEQQDQLVQEEKNWWKKLLPVRVAKEEHEWIDDIVIDARIGLRMRKFEVDQEDEDRARRIGDGSAAIPGRKAGRVAESDVVVD